MLSMFMKDPPYSRSVDDLQKMLNRMARDGVLEYRGGKYLRK
jgi:hypothetical protein